MLCPAPNELLQVLSTLLPLSLVLKSPEHQPIHATAPHPLCLFLNLTSSLLLALPLGCLSCSSQDLCPGSSSRTLWLLLPSQLACPCWCPRELHPFTGRGHHPALASPWPPITADTLPARASPAFTSCSLSLMKRNDFCCFPRL